MTDTQDINQIINDEDPGKETDLMPSKTGSVGAAKKSKKKVRKNASQPELLTGYRVMSVRLRAAEFLEFSEQVKRAGLKNNKAMRIAARKIAGFLEIDEEYRNELRELTNKIGSISSSVSQLARELEHHSGFELEKFYEERESLGREFAKIDKQMQFIMNVSHRRSDGLHLLQEADE